MDPLKKFIDYLPKFLLRSKPEVVKELFLDELSFRDLETYNVVRFVDIGVAISAVPSFESPLLNTIGY